MRTVADVMSEPVVVNAACTVQDASRVMLDAGVKVAVIVCGGVVCGLLTAADVAHALLEGYDPAHTPVEVIANHHPPLARADEPLAAVRERMRGTERPLAIVIGAERRPLGLLS
jgi:CBS domain-containing protein